MKLYNVVIVTESYCIIQVYESESTPFDVVTWGERNGCGCGCVREAGGILCSIRIPVHWRTGGKKVKITI